MNGNGNAVKMHHITPRNTSNDVEACPKDSRETINPTTLYPQGHHTSKREAFKEEVSVRLR